MSPVSAVLKSAGMNSAENASAVIQPETEESLLLSASSHNNRQQFDHDRPQPSGQ